MKIRKLVRIWLWKSRLRLSTSGLVASAFFSFVCASAAQAQNPQMVPVLQGLLQKYKGCILERYETQADMATRRLDPRLSGLTTTAGLQPRDQGVVCAAGNVCTLASRAAAYAQLDAQANRGDPTNFEANLERAIPRDCFQCQKHQEWHTKHVHCTMDCGGNNGFTQGPCFEGCKAGVDLTQLVRDVDNDIRSALQSLIAPKGTPPPGQQSVTGGSTIATNYQFVTPPKESCPKPVLDKPAYFFAPRDMLDWTPELSHTVGGYDLIGFNPSVPPTPAMYASPPDRIVGSPGSTQGANEGRVRAELRAVAARRDRDPNYGDPIYSLCQAAQRFTRNQPASGSTPSDHDFGNAFADLSVAGKASFAKFVQLHPTEATLRNQQACAGASDSSISTALNRAYSVASALRGPHDSTERRTLGWIAVSGEDDQPYRPVNVPTNRGHFPEFHLQVLVPRFNIPIKTRYVIAHAQPPVFARPAQPLVDGGTRKVPADLLPALKNDAEVLLFIHGMDSRLEEADDLTEAMHHLPGHNWTIIAMDLPTSGYADNIDHRRISPLTAVQCHSTPLVDFLEEFIVAFVDKLDTELHGQLKPRIKAVVGGSLGGNMAMRLGRRPNTPWISRVVPWSPAAIWPSYIAQHNAVAAGCDTGWDLTKDQAVQQSLKWAGLEEKFLPNHETPQLRRELFYAGWDYAPVRGIGGPPQAQCWFSNGFACKSAEILASRLERQETYDANFRAWHWRLGGEQLAFSHQQFAAGTRTPLYLLNTKRMLLLSGCEDNCAQLGPYTQDVAKKMVNTPGYALFLQQTGHSLDNEHPSWVAKQIADFINSAPGHGAGGH